MDVSYSAWRQSTEESLALKGESFSFLFDRRYTNRLNRMSRVFFEAYVRATKELALQEDRFPSLSEIDAKMESGAVYAFKDRLTKNTEFFDEVKISGVSYLVPRAKRFVDASGTYTDLAFNFDDAAVILPARRKMPAPAEPVLLETERVDQIDEAERTAEEKIIEMAMPSPTDALAEKKETDADRELPAGVLGGVLAYPDHASETHVDAAGDSRTGEDKKVMAETSEYPTKVSAPSLEIKKPKPAEKEVRAKSNLRIVIAGLISLAVILAAGVYLTGFSSVGSPKLVKYSSFLSNATQGNYLGVDIENQDGISNEIEMMLPPNIDRSISSQGGIITISHSGYTFIRLNSSSDASVRLFLSSNWTAIPVTLSLEVPKGYDSGLVVHAKDYDVNRKDNKIILRFNCTQDGINFEQSFSPKR
jgi:hypothetical protein